MPEPSTTKLIALIMGCMLLFGCVDSGENGKPAGSGGQQAPDADIFDEIERTDVAVDPDLVSPGDPLELHFVDDEARGGHFVLYRHKENGWAPTHDLVSSGVSRIEEPEWVTFDQDFDAPDVSISEPGPDYVTVPPDAEAGSYLLCEQRADQVSCSSISVNERVCEGDDGAGLDQSLMVDDWIQAEPDDIRPGEEFDVTFPTSRSRGILFILEECTAAGWEGDLYLTSHSSNGSLTEEPGWTQSDEPVGVPDLAVGGEGPDRLVMPPIAEPGPHRLCTRNAFPNFCTEIEVSEG